MGRCPTSRSAKLRNWAICVQPISCGVRVLKTGLRQPASSRHPQRLPLQPRRHHRLPLRQGLQLRLHLPSPNSGPHHALAIPGPHPPTLSRRVQVLRLPHTLRARLWQRPVMRPARNPMPAPSTGPVIRTRPAPLIRARGPTPITRRLRLHCTQRHRREPMGLALTNPRRRVIHGSAHPAVTTRQHTTIPTRTTLPLAASLGCASPSS